MKLSIQTKTTIETTVTPPIFWRQGNEYRGLISEDDYREFVVIDKCVWLKMTEAKLNKSAIETAFVEWEQIPESVFMDQYEQVLQSMSLTPKLTTHD